MKRLLLLLITLIFLLLSSCKNEERKSFSILSYNMYLFFDDEETGNEYYPFVSSAGYGEQEYKKRIRLYQDFFLSDIGEADVYALQEIESEKVLKDLMSGRMARKGYKYYAISNINSPISVAFISRIPIKDVKVHSDLGPRPIIEIVLYINNEEVRIFNIHAKSQIDGGYEERFSSFSHLSRLLSSSSSLSIAAGDFNEDPRIGPSFVDAATGLDAPLLVTGDRGLVSNTVFFAPSLSEAADMSTYYYEGSWYTYDNMIFNSAAFDGFSLEYESAYIVYPPSALNDDGTPKIFSIDTQSGYSDHLALKCIFTYN